MIIAISKSEAKKMAMARLVLIVPSAIIGMFFGLYASSATLTGGFLLVVIPVILIIAAGSIWLGLHFAIKKETGTEFNLESDFLQKTLNTGNVTIINLNEGITLKENSMGLTAKDRVEKIFIPKQLEMYTAMKSELEKRVK